MSSSDSESPDEAESTRPISVAELLARNGTIGAPPAGGRRRRRRGKDNVTVAELTGEIPVIRDDTPPPQAEEPEPEPEAETAAEPEAETAAEPELEEAAEAEVEPAAEPVSSETVIIYSSAAQMDSDVVETAEAVEEVEQEHAPPPRASDPLPRRGGRPERGHDPRVIRRSAQTGAEQMAFDPVDGAVDLSDLVDAEEEQKLRSYLRASEGTLFSGDTVADDMARRGITDDDLPEAGEPGERRAIAAPPNRLHAARQAAIAIGQSALAVVLGAGLFLGFDQLWRWNTIVALVLSVLVILGLVIAVRVVRRTEDIASTLIAVAVGALVTLGPLALLQSYG